MRLLGILSSVFVLVYSFINRDVNFFLNLSDATFLLSLFFISIFAIIYVRNIGLFKTFAYLKYKREFMAENEEKDKEDKNFNEKLEERMDTGVDLIGDEMLEFHEFIERKYKKKWPSKPFLIYAAISYTLSIFFSYLI